MRSVLLSLVALAGCDNVFRLLPLPDPVIDAPDVDAAPIRDTSFDAPPGCATKYRSPGDLDGDGDANEVDRCPQIAGAQADADGDGLGDECDPHPATFGDCILLLDDFTNLGCWHPNETWVACGSGVCPPAAGATVELARPLQIDTAELRGTIEQDLGGGPTIALMLNDTQSGPGLTGNACELVNNSTDVMATSFTTYSNNAQVAADPTNNQPAQITTEGNLQAVVAWQVQTAVTPNYQCVTTTSSTAAVLSSGLRYPIVAPSGAQAVIRTRQVVFRPRAFVAYGFGPQCNQP